MSDFVDTPFWSVMNLPTSVTFELPYFVVVHAARWDAATVATTKSENRFMAGRQRVWLPDRRNERRKYCACIFHALF